jgi:alpha/beta superfamily hydrolase
MILNTGLGMHVFIPNSRSVGNSTGRASFSGKSEATDLEELTQWCVNKVGNVDCVVVVVCFEFCVNAECPV